MRLTFITPFFLLGFSSFAKAAAVLAPPAPSSLSAPVSFHDASNAPLSPSTASQNSPSRPSLDPRDNHLHRRAFRSDVLTRLAYDPAPAGTPPVLHQRTNYFRIVHGRTYIYSFISTQPIARIQAWIIDPDDWQSGLEWTWFPQPDDTSVEFTVQEQGVAWAWFAIEYRAADVGAQPEAVGAVFEEWDDGT